MADTGAPHFIPYVEPTDLVRDYPAADEASAFAVAAALDAAGGLVAVKSAIFTGTQVASLAQAANVAVTDLSITHGVADAGNKLIISAFFGAAASTEARNGVGIAIHDGTGLIAIGDAASNRTRVTAGGGYLATDAGGMVITPSVTFVHAPGDTASRTYTVRAINISGPQTIFINRTENDTDASGFPRAVSSLVIQEVKV